MFCKSSAGNVESRCENGLLVMHSHYALFRYGSDRTLPHHSVASMNPVQVKIRAVGRSGLVSHEGDISGQSIS